MKEFLLVSAGSFLSGGMRFLVSKLLGLHSMHHPLLFAAYVVLSLAVGVAALWAGQRLAA